MILKVVSTIFFLVQSKAIVNHNPSKLGCPDQVSPLDNLLIDRFAGVWFSIQKYSMQFEVGKCIMINLGFTRLVNSTSVTITHSQKVGNNFTVFEQNATVRNAINSIWAFKFNRSLTGNYVALFA